MAKVKDYDLTSQPLELQKFTDEVQQIINNGSVEIEVTNASSPAYDAPDETRLVFSVFGSQIRLYISYLGDWYFTTFAQL